METITSEHGKTLIVYQNFKFTNCGKTVKRIKQGCKNKKSVSKIYTDKAESVVLGELF